MFEIDKFDKAILSLLQKDSRQTGQQLSEQVGLSSAACLRRIQRLRKIGAIEREIAVVSPAWQPEMRTQVVVTLSVTKNSPRCLSDLARELSRHKEVQRVLSVAGDDDLILFMGFASVEAYSDFAETHFQGPRIEGFKSRFVLRDLSRCA